MYLILKFIVLTILSQILYAKKLEIKSLNEDSILIVKTNDCKIQTGNIKLIHPINLTNLEITVESINKFVSNRVNDKSELYRIITEKCKKLHNNFAQIRPIQHNRYKRWDTLGSAWKWLAGNPDALDLRVINSTMNELIKENNQQFRVNEQINERIRLITDTVNKAVTSTTMSNKVILSELETITLIINIETMNTILEDIQEAIIKTKIELPSSKILSLKEIIIVKDLLINQGVNITLSDEALQYVRPKIAVKSDTLLYILEVPKLQEAKSAALMIAPLTIKDTIIKNYPQHLIKSEQQLFVSLNYKNFVQRHAEIQEFEDNCIKPLIMGTRSHCNVSSNTGTTLHLIAENKLLIDNAKNETLSSDCGPSNRTLTGNFLITFGNCTLTISNKKFQSFEIRSETQEIQGALYNLQVSRQLVKEINIESIEQQNIQNRKKLSHVYLRQEGHQHWIWTLSGGVSLSTIGVLMLFAYIVTHLRAKQIKIGNSSRSRPTTSNEHETTECSTSRINLEMGSKNADVLSLPPGGVILS